MKRQIQIRIGSPNYCGIRYLAGSITNKRYLTATLQRQIVIQIGEEQNGMVIVRNGDNKQGSCPTQYLQEV